MIIITSSEVKIPGDFNNHSEYLLKSSKQKTECHAMEAFAVNHG